MKIAIIGSRSFNDWDAFNKGVNLIENKTWNTWADGELSFVSGGAKGTDKMAERLSVETKIPIDVFLPDYEKHGKGATHIRNRKIVDSCDKLIPFWDGESKGTSSVIEYARKKGKDIKVILTKIKL